MATPEKAKPATARTVNRLQMSGEQTSQAQDNPTALEQQPETAMAAAIRKAMAARGRA